MVECPLVRVRSLFFHINRSMFVGIASALAIKASPVAPENRPLDVDASSRSPMSRVAEDYLVIAFHSWRNNFASAVKPSRSQNSVSTWSR